MTRRDYHLHVRPRRARPGWVWDEWTTEVDEAVTPMQTLVSFVVFALFLGAMLGITVLVWAGMQ